MACSTCHVVVDPEFYAQMALPTDAENDMLDLAHGLSKTSRLGCQIVLTSSLDGLHVTVPDGVNNVWN
jgi:ferredoxin